MTKHAFLLLIALLTPVPAHACENLEVTVLPFNVQRDYTKSREQLAEMGAGDEVGLVRTTAYARVDGCTVTVGYKDPVLYVARELRSNDCAFQHVLKHEEEHVTIYRRHLGTLEATIRAGVETTDDLFAIASRAVLAVRAQHKEFDSPEEYATNRTACFGRVARLVAGR